MPTTTLSSHAALAELRQRIERVSAPARPRTVLPFGIAALDAALPANGLALGAVHEFSDTGPDAWRAPLSTLFAAGILARLRGPVLWCLHSRDLFAPALARVGLHPDRVIYCETWKDSEVLPAMEDGLRYSGLAGVVGELTRLPLAQSRRLQLAAEGSGVIALVLRRSGAERDEPNAAFSRWQIAAAASPDGGDFGMGRARWNVELARCRGAESHSWVLEACDAKGRLAVSSDLSDRSDTAEAYKRASA
jgi:protein ImuA